MTDKNPNPLKAEYNSGEYLSIPRQSLRLKDVLGRAIRGAMLDCQDMSDSFEPSETDEDTFDEDARWSYDDHVDAYNHQQEMVDRAHSRRRAAAKYAQQASGASHSATNGRANEEFDKRRRSAETSEERGHEEPKSAGDNNPRAN